MKIIKLQEAQNICDEILKEYKSIGVVCYELYTLIKTRALRVGKKFDMDMYSKLEIKYDI